MRLPRSLSLSRAHANPLLPPPHTHAHTSPSLQGLGPTFTLLLRLSNSGAAALRRIPIAFTYDTTLFRMSAPLAELSVVLPGSVGTLHASLESIDPEGRTGTVRAVVCNPSGGAPLISAHVSIPLSEPPVDAVT